MYSSNYTTLHYNETRAKSECFLKSLWFITTSRISTKTQFQLLMVAYSCNTHPLLLFQLREERDDRGFSLFPNVRLRTEYQK